VKSAPRAPRRSATLSLTLAALLLGGGCATWRTLPPPVAAAPGEAAVRSELIFGRLRPGGSVSDAEWRAFVVEQVTPRFPDGFTVLEALGQYRDRTGTIITEPAKMLLILHDGTPRQHAAIQEIREAYRRLFQQESVLLVTSPARLSY